jgi:hypothetical protein
MIKYDAEYQKKYRLKNKKYIKKYKIRYYFDHKEHLTFLMKKRAKKNKAKKAEYDKIYRKKNKEKISKYLKKYGKEYSKNRKKIDPQFKLALNLRSRLYSALKGNYKSGSAVKDLGGSISDLKVWLECQFYEGMSWRNYGRKPGQWSIDHIKPLSNFDLSDRNQLLEVCNYRNLRPMWHIDNQRKSNKNL